MRQVVPALLAGFSLDGLEVTWVCRSRKKAWWSIVARFR